MNEAIKKRVSHRSKIIEGQMKGLRKMIDNDEYCMDIMAQSLAIQRSLSSLNKLVLQNHIETHITSMLSSGDEPQQMKAQQELANLYELHNIRGR